MSIILSLTVVCIYVCMYVSTILLYFYILTYSASNGCKCVSINSVQFSSVKAFGFVDSQRGFNADTISL